MNLDEIVLKFDGKDKLIFKNKEKIVFVLKLLPNTVTELKLGELQNV